MEAIVFCETCGKEIITDWRKDPRTRKTEPLRFCSRSCANKRTHTKETISKISSSMVDFCKKAGRIRPTCKTCGKALDSSNKTGYCLKCLHSNKKLMSEISKKVSKSCKGICGGYRHGSGRGKNGWYKGYYCDSSWELAYVIYNLEHNIEFKRNKELFPYEFNGEQHNYKPDFIEGDIYVEIKGYFSEQVFAKSKNFPYKLKYIDKTSIKPYLEYTVEKYGKDFIRLYES